MADSGRVSYCPIRTDPIANVRYADYSDVQYLDLPNSDEEETVDTRGTVVGDAQQPEGAVETGEDEFPKPAKTKGKKSRNGKGIDDSPKESEPPAIVEDTSDGDPAEVIGSSSKKKKSRKARQKAKKAEKTSKSVAKTPDDPISPAQQDTNPEIHSEMEPESNRLSDSEPQPEQVHSQVPEKAPELEKEADYSPKIMPEPVNTESEAAPVTVTDADSDTITPDIRPEAGVEAASLEPNVASQESPVDTAVGLDMEPAQEKSATDLTEPSVEKPASLLEATESPSIDGISARGAESAEGPAKVSAEPEELVEIEKPTERKVLVDPEAPTEPEYLVGPETSTVAKCEAPTRPAGSKDSILPVKSEAATEAAGDEANNMSLTESMVIENTPEGSCVPEDELGKQATEDISKDDEAPSLPTSSTSTQAESIPAESETAPEITETETMREAEIQPEEQLAEIHPDMAEDVGSIAEPSPEPVIQVPTSEVGSPVDNIEVISKDIVEGQLETQVLEPAAEPEPELVLGEPEPKETGSVEESKAVNDHFAAQQNSGEKPVYASLEMEEDYSENGAEPVDVTEVEPSLEQMPPLEDAQLEELLNTARPMENDLSNDSLNSQAQDVEIPESISNEELAAPIIATAFSEDSTSETEAIDKSGLVKTDPNATDMSEADQTEIDDDKLQMTVAPDELSEEDITVEQTNNCSALPEEIEDEVAEDELSSVDEFDSEEDGLKHDERALDEDITFRRIPDNSEDVAHESGSGNLKEETSFLAEDPAATDELSTRAVDTGSEEAPSVAGSSDGELAIVEEIDTGALDENHAIDGSMPMEADDELPTPEIRSMKNPLEKDILVEVDNEQTPLEGTPADEDSVEETSAVKSFDDTTEESNVEDHPTGEPFDDEVDFGQDPTQGSPAKDNEFDGTMQLNSVNEIRNAESDTESIQREALSEKGHDLTETPAGEKLVEEVPGESQSQRSESEEISSDEVAQKEADVNQIPAEKTSVEGSPAEEPATEESDVCRTTIEDGPIENPSVGEVHTLASDTDAISTGKLTDKEADVDQTLAAEDPTEELDIEEISADESVDEEADAGLPLVETLVEETDVEEASGQGSSAEILLVDDILTEGSDDHEADDDDDNDEAPTENDPAERGTDTVEAPVEQASVGEVSEEDSDAEDVVAEEISIEEPPTEESVGDSTDVDQASADESLAQENPVEGRDEGASIQKTLTKQGFAEEPHADGSEFDGDELDSADDAPIGNTKDVEADVDELFADQNPPNEWSREKFDDDISAAEATDIGETADEQSAAGEIDDDQAFDKESITDELPEIDNSNEKLLVEELGDEEVAVTESTADVADQKLDLDNISVEGAFADDASVEGSDNQENIIQEADVAEYFIPRASMERAASEEFEPEEGDDEETGASDVPAEEGPAGDLSIDQNLDGKSELEASDIEEEVVEEETPVDFGQTDAEDADSEGGDLEEVSAHIFVPEQFTGEEADIDKISLDDQRETPDPRAVAQELPFEEADHEEVLAEGSVATQDDIAEVALDEDTNSEVSVDEVLTEKGTTTVTGEASAGDSGAHIGGDREAETVEAAIQETPYEGTSVNNISAEEVPGEGIYADEATSEQVSEAGPVFEQAYIDEPRTEETAIAEASTTVIVAEESEVEMPGDEEEALMKESFTIETIADSISDEDFETGEIPVVQLTAEQVAAEEDDIPSPIIGETSINNPIIDVAPSEETDAEGTPISVDQGTSPFKDVSTDNAAIKELRAEDGLAAESTSPLENAQSARNENIEQSTEEEHESVMDETTELEEHTSTEGPLEVAGEELGPVNDSSYREEKAAQTVEVVEEEDPAEESLAEAEPPVEEQDVSIVEAMSLDDPAIAEEALSVEDRLPAGKSAMMDEVSDMASAKIAEADSIEIAKPIAQEVTEEPIETSAEEADTAEEAITSDSPELLDNASPVEILAAVQTGAVTPTDESEELAVKNARIIEPATETRDARRERRRRSSMKEDRHHSRSIRVLDGAQNIPEPVIEEGSRERDNHTGSETVPDGDSEPGDSTPGVEESEPTVGHGEETGIMKINAHEGLEYPASQALPLAEVSPHAALEVDEGNHISILEHEHLSSGSVQDVQEDQKRDHHYKTEESSTDYCFDVVRQDEDRELETPTAGHVNRLSQFRPPSQALDTLDSSRPVTPDVVVPNPDDYPFYNTDQPNTPSVIIPDPFDDEAKELGRGRALKRKRKHMRRRYEESVAAAVVMVASVRSLSHSSNSHPGSPDRAVARDRETSHGIDSIMTPRISEGEVSEDIDGNITNGNDSDSPNPLAEEESKPRSFREHRGEHSRHHHHVKHSSHHHRSSHESKGSFSDENRRRDSNASARKNSRIHRGLYEDKEMNGLILPTHARHDSGVSTANHDVTSKHQRTPEEQEAHERRKMEHRARAREREQRHREREREREQDRERERERERDRDREKAREREREKEKEKERERDMDRDWARDEEKYRNGHKNGERWSENEEYTPWQSTGTRRSLSFRGGPPLTSDSQGHRRFFDSRHTQPITSPNISTSSTAVRTEKDSSRSFESPKQSQADVLKRSATVREDRHREERARLRRQHERDSSYDTGRSPKNSLPKIDARDQGKQPSSSRADVVTGEASLDYPYSSSSRREERQKTREAEAEKAEKKKSGKGIRGVFKKIFN